MKDCEPVRGLFRRVHAIVVYGLDLIKRKVMARRMRPETDRKSLVLFKLGM